MTADPDDLRELLLKIRYDATAVQAKVTDALDLLGRLNVERPLAPLACPVSHCGLHVRSQVALTDHLANVHGIDSEPQPGRDAA